MRALVTGAAREGGIGQAIVARLQADGMEVVTLDVAPGCTWRRLARSAAPVAGVSACRGDDGVQAATTVRAARTAVVRKRAKLGESTVGHDPASRGLA